MTDEKLIKALKIFDEESQSQGFSTGTAFMNRFPFRRGNAKNSKVKTNIFLNCLSDEELNDLAAVIMIANHDKYNRKNPSWIKVKKELTFGDYPAIKKEVFYKRMTGKECIAYLRKWSAAALADYIRTYISFEPMTQRQRNLLKDANNSRISAIMHTNKIEMR